MLKSSKRDPQKLLELLNLFEGLNEQSGIEAYMRFQRAINTATVALLKGIFFPKEENAKLLSQNKNTALLKIRLQEVLMKKRLDADPNKLFHQYLSAHLNNNNQKNQASLVSFSSPSSLPGRRLPR